MNFVKTASVLASVIITCGFSLACAKDGTMADRENTLKKLIKKNLHIGPHLTSAIDERTVKALREQIEQSDIAILVNLLSDKDATVAIAAQLMLIEIGQPSLPYIESALSSLDAKASVRALQAIESINQRKNEQEE